MNLGVALEMLGARTENAAFMDEAIRSMSGAVEAYQKAGEGYWLPIAQQRVTEMQGEWVELKR